MKFSLEDLLKATGGKCLNPERLGNNLVTSVSIDTRTIQRGALFIPIKGEQFDGHGFIETAYEKGAIVTFTQEEKISETNLCHIYVKDTKKALGDLAHYYRQQFSIPFIAVTGSVGKTSTKDLIAAVLSAKYRVHKTEGNFNNDIGVPLTLLRLNVKDEISVIEMGMNHLGEIAYLSHMVQPDMAVITNIGVSHIENLGSQEGILKAKLEITEGLKKQGKLIVCGDDAHLNKILFPKITYGKNVQNDYRVIQIENREGEVCATLCSQSQTYDMKIHALGEHMIYNALAALAVAEHFDLSKEEILRGYLVYKPSNMRMQRKRSPNGLTLLDDAYNASPESMEAALLVLEQYEAEGKKIAVLGDMFEMGTFSQTLHEKVGLRASQMQIDCICVIGPFATYIGKEASKNASIEVKYYTDKQSFIKDCPSFLKPNDVLLFKASRGMHFEEIVEAVGKVNFDEK
jgi:UDP-N-acetylmuramoyl-tripeptide--D-alanyl-D-alanine ligase